MLLRQYQHDIVAKTRAAIASGHKRVLIVSPTGSGKTVLVSYMIQQALAKGTRCLFLVHRRELVQQTLRTFAEFNIHGCTVESIQKVSRHPERYSADLIVLDEAHHAAAASWSKTLKAFGNAYVVGLSATPLRIDGRGLAEHFDTIVEGPTVKNLIDEGYLSRYRLFAPSNVDTTGLHTRAGDWVRSEVDSLVNKPAITGNVVRTYQRLCGGKRAIVFCVSVAHSRAVAESFLLEGISAKHIDGGMNDRERDGAVRAFRSGTIQVLCNCDLFGEGFDCPGIECAILLRPTQSFALFRQQVGRALRPCEGKSEAIILDHVGNSARFGLPDDHVEWSLQGRTSTRKSSGPGVRICTTCFAANRQGATVCDYCNTPFPVEPRAISAREGELIEIRERRAKQGQCRTYEELVVEGKRRGYKNPNGWAYFVSKARGKH